MPLIKRKYTKRGCIVHKIANKRGRKKRVADVSPEQLLDYIIRNYPQLGVDKIKDKILITIKSQNGLFLPNYVLDILEYKGKKYYYDMYGNLLNENAENVGQYIDIGDEKKIYLYEDTYDDKINIDDIILSSV